MKAVFLIPALVFTTLAKAEDKKPNVWDTICPKLAEKVCSQIFQPAECSLTNAFKAEASNECQARIKVQDQVCKKKAFDLNPDDIKCTPKK